MNDEMKTEAMELCVTACEKFSSNNEVKYTNVQFAKQPDRYIINFCM